IVAVADMAGTGIAEPDEKQHGGDHRHGGFGPCYTTSDNSSHGPARFMNILVLGSGGREHALAWKMAASPLTERLYCAPGNAGIAQEAECVPLDLADHAAVVAFCREHRVDLVVVGPEAPLCAGIVDDLESAGIKAFGPTRAAA